MEEAIKRGHDPKTLNHSGIATTLELLNKWELPELCDVFRDQEISVRALKYLTEPEICELIPKIGLRTIFRAMLIKWRRDEEILTKPEYVVAEKRKYDTTFHTSAQNSLKDENVKVIDTKTEETHPKATIVVAKKQKTDTAASNASLQNPIELESFIMKYELNSDDSNDMYILNDELLMGAAPTLSPNSQNQPSPTSFESADNDEKTRIKKQSQLDILHDNEKFNVRELIMNNPEGKKIFNYNKKHGHLDTSNRKRLVKIIITDAVERHIKMRTAVYFDIIHQIIRMFPNEKPEVYYVPSSQDRHHSSKGMLYYKFSNLKRRLRKMNLL